MAAFSVELANQRVEQVQGVEERQHLERQTGVEHRSGLLHPQVQRPLGQLQSLLGAVRQFVGETLRLVEQLVTWHRATDQAYLRITD